MLFSYAIEGFLGWVFFCVWFNVHTFNRRHRADRRVEGWLRRNGYQYIYCLPPAGVRIRSQGKRLLPASGRWSHTLPRFKLMRRLRRRNHEWVEWWMSIYVLPASGRWSHSLPRFKLMRRLRRRNHEWAGGWVGKS